MVESKLFAKSGSSFMKKIVEGALSSSHSQVMGNGTYRNRKYLKLKIFNTDGIMKSNMHSSPLFEWNHSNSLTIFSEESSLYVREKIYW